MSDIKEMETKENELWNMNEFAGHTIRMRNSDGYLCATDMAKLNSKKNWSDYFRLKQSTEFINALTALGIPRADLIDSITANTPERGTWIHPKVAIHFAMWISPEFSVKVIDWVHRFLQGDITLVRDIVERHDAVNNTHTEILITTMQNQLEEYKTQVHELETVKNELKIQLERLNEFTCKFCDRRYSSTAGLTRHLKNCVDKEMRNMSLNIDFDKFKAYMSLLTGYAANDFNYELKTEDWAGNDPVLIVKNRETHKIVRYNAKYNEQRWKAVKLLQKRVYLPVQLLLDESSCKFMDDNHTKFSPIARYLYGRDRDDVVVLLEEEFKTILNIGDEEDED